MPDDDHVEKVIWTQNNGVAFDLFYTLVTMIKPIFI